MSQAIPSQNRPQHNVESSAEVDGTQVRKARKPLQYLFCGLILPLLFADYPYRKGRFLDDIYPEAPRFGVQYNV
jgi:hypothetical protein